MEIFTYRNKKTYDYFEGWYTRLTDEKNNLHYAIIIGITKESSDPHSFIQIYDGSKLSNKYYRFDIDDFSFSNDIVYIKNNYLSKDTLYIKTKDIEINVVFKHQRYLQKRINNSAMSFLAKFPLECYQDIVFMDTVYNGEITHENKLYSSTGKGYMEKTYGSNFPRKWIWLQCNHFNKDVSFAFAHGLMPVLKFELKGFFAMLQHNGKEYRFGLYNFSKLKLIEKSDSNLVFNIKKRRYRIEVSAQILKNCKLVGPSKNGNMNLDVYESINSLMHIRFTKGKKVIFETLGRNVGIENMYR